MRSKIVRDAVAARLAERRRNRLAKDIERYAAAEAGGAYDLGAELEAASVEHLLGLRGGWR